MSGCCDPSGYRGAFNKKVAARYVHRFTKKGLDSTAGPMVDALREASLEGAAVLEIGAGSGTALVAMLEAGAVSGLGIDISPSYEKVAGALFAERGHTDSVTWVNGDFVALADDVAEVDVVFGNRVVCCYPFMDDLVDAASAKARHHLALAYPRRRWRNSVGTRFINFWMRLHHNSFRTFVHDPVAIADRVAASGFEEMASGRTSLWQWTVWRRTEPNPV